MATPLRTDCGAEPLRAAAKASNDAAQARRLLALASIYDGSSRTEAARIGAVTVQIVRDWVVKFNAHGPAGLIGGIFAAWIEGFSRGQQFGCHAITMVVAAEPR